MSELEIHRHGHHVLVWRPLEVRKDCYGWTQCKQVSGENADVRLGVQFPYGSIFGIPRLTTRR